MPSISDSDRNDLLGAALAYAALGWPVFPVAAGRKTPLTTHGFKDATTEPRLIRGWWEQWPQANIGVATGSPALDVLDVDVRAAEGGWPSLNKLTRAKLFTAARPWIATPSGGRHVYFEGTRQRCGSLPRLHLDFKATGGYVLVPPSSVNGRRYEFRVRREISGTLDWAAVRKLLDPPPDGKRLSSPGRGGSGIGALVAWMESQPHGNHNNGLFWAACRAVEGGLDPWPLADAAVRAGHDERRAVRTVGSALRRRRP